ncbi:MAG: carbohydrate ABC transporter permease [Alphaproteobacteria bacterium]
MYRKSIDLLQRHICFWLPLISVLLLTSVWPLLLTFFYSFTDAQIDNPSLWNFVGLKNFLFLVQDSNWWIAVKNNLIFTIISVSLETILGLSFALILNQYLPFKGVFRSIMILPWAIPAVVGAKMWEWMFHDQNGIINEVLLSLGLISEKIAWMASSKTSLGAIIFADVWQATPFMTLMCLAALQTLPLEVFDAAKVDGASAFQRFRNITLPLIKPALLVAILFRSIDTLKIFDLPYVLGANNSDTVMMSIYAREQLIDFQDQGYGSAVAGGIFMVIALFVIIYMQVSQLKTFKGV